MVMEIAAMSMAMSSASFQQQASISMLKKAMDQTEVASDTMVQMMNQVPTQAPGSSIGQNIDMYI